MTTNKIKEELATVALFDGLHDRFLSQIAQFVTPAQIKKHRSIYSPETQTRYIYFLVSGHVKIVRMSEDGREAILDVLGPGETFGECCLLGEAVVDDLSIELARALDDVRLYYADRNTFLAFLQKSPDLNAHFLNLTLLKMRKLEAKFENLLFADARHRVIKFICQYAEAFGRIRHKRVTVDNFLSQKEIAQYTGTSRQTVATILNTLRKQGHIEFSSRKFTILNAQWLQQKC